MFMCVYIHIDVNIIKYINETFATLMAANVLALFTEVRILGIMYTMGTGGPVSRLTPMSQNSPKIPLWKTFSSCK